MKTLPKIPSELIRLALEDLRKVEGMPEKYEVDMEQWHNPIPEICHVCLAGAVMSQTLEARSSEYMSPRYFGENKPQLHALSDFVFGATRYAFRLLDIETSFKSRVVCPYETNKEQFHTDMHKLADDLEAAGL